MSKRDIQKGGIQDPFNTYDQFSKPELDKPFEVFTANAVAGIRDQKYRAALSGLMPHPITLPQHLYMPEDAQSMDLRELRTVTNTSTVVLLSFTAPDGRDTRFLSYAISSSAAHLTNIRFTPKVNGVRAFPFHGNPNANFAIDEASTADLFEAIPIPCLLQLQPRDVLTWEFTNNSGATVNAGIRMQGYITASTVRKPGRFGG